MRLEDLQKEARSLLTGFVTEAKGATASDQADLLRSFQGLYLRVFRVVYDLPGLKNLDAERRNFPALDLGDDKEGIAFQLTADRSLDKVTGVIEAVIGHGLHVRFPRVRVYVITERQNSYSQEAIDRVTQGKFHSTLRKTYSISRACLLISRTWRSKPSTRSSISCDFIDRSQLTV